MIKLKLFVLCFILIGSRVFSLNINVANLNIYRTEVNVALTNEEEKATELIFKHIKDRDQDGLLNIQAISRSIIYSDKITKSTLEASELCELLHIDYLIYGFIEKTSKYYNAEVRLFENDTKSDKKVFYVKTEVGDIKEVVDELAYKITNYLYNMLGASEYYKEKKKGFGGIEAIAATGYWIPMPNWWNIITGVINFETGVNVIPVTPIAKYRNFGFYIKFGFDVSYSLGINKSGYLESYFNSIAFKIPISMCFEIFTANVFILGLGPQVQLDILYQKKLFDDPSTYKAAAFGLFASIGYEYWFGKKKYIGAGINNIFDFSFYEDMYIDYKIQFYVGARIPVVKENKEEIRNEKLEMKNDEKIEIKNKELETKDNSVDVN